VSYNYAPLAAKAVALIAKYGKTVTLEFTPLTTADANKPWRGPGGAAVTTKTPKGLTSTFEKDELDGERIKVTDIKLLIAGQDAEMSGVDIDRATRCQVSGVWYGASDVSPIEPGDTKMLYTLRLRQG